MERQGFWSLADLSWPPCHTPYQLQDCGLLLHLLDPYFPCTERRITASVSQGWLRIKWIMQVLHLAQDPGHGGCVMHVSSLLLSSRASFALCFLPARFSLLFSQLGILKKIRGWLIVSFSTFALFVNLQPTRAFYFPLHKPPANSDMFWVCVFDEMLGPNTHSSCFSLANGLSRSYPKSPGRGLRPGFQCWLCFLCMTWALWLTTLSFIGLKMYMLPISQDCFER